VGVFVNSPVAAPRRFPPPWSVDDSGSKLGQECYIVRDANGYSLRQVPDFAMRFKVSGLVERNF
jgi:hypothetical protein